MADRLRIRPLDGLCLCSTCGKQYTEVRDFNRHIRKEHPDELLKDVPESRMSSCSTCGKQYTEVRNLNRHIRKEHPDELLKDVPESGVRVQPMSSCSTCGKQYTEVSNLNRHIRKEHPDEFLKDVPESGVRVQPMSSCSTCGKQYTEVSNLNRHIRKEHPDELLKDVPESGVKVQLMSSCSTCGKQYTEVRNLNRHIRKEHPDELLKEGQDADASEIKRVKCDMCDKIYKGSKQMRFHMRRVHRTDPTRSALPTLCCPMHCDAKFMHCKELDDHLTVEHGVVIESSVVEFDSIAEFESWKAGVESTTSSSFVKHSVTANHLYYYCHRSGVPRTQYAERIQWKPTIKTGKCCPARITVKRDERTQKLNVTHYQTHVGHTKSIQYMKLNKRERRMLAGKIKSGVACIRMRQKISNQTLKNDIPLENNGDEAYSSYEEVVVETVQSQHDVRTGEEITTYHKVQQVLNDALALGNTLSCEGKEHMWKETEEYFQKIQALSSQFPNDGVETSAESVPKFDKNEVTSNHKSIICQRFYSAKKKSIKKGETVQLSKPTMKNTSEEQLEMHNDFDHKYS